MNDKICFYENFKLEISSIDNNFCNILINSFISNKNLEISYQPVKLENIEIDEGRIAFASTTGLYSFVYSPDKKPTWLHSRDEDFLIQVKKSSRRLVSCQKMVTI